MFLPMIVYCIESSSKDCISVLDAGYQDTKVKDDGEDEDDIKRDPPTEVLWYFPIIPRLKRFFFQC